MVIPQRVGSYNIKVSGVQRESRREEGGGWRREVMPGQGFVGRIGVREYIKKSRGFQGEGGRKDLL
jgi:hypothetical protein